MTGPLAVEELRRLFLFRELAEHQLRWIAREARTAEVPDGAVLCRQGEPAEHLWVLVRGEMVLETRTRDVDLELTRSGRPGAYGGATQPYPDGVPRCYPHTVRIACPATVLVLPARAWSRQLRVWFPMPMLLAEGVLAERRTNAAFDDDRHRHLALTGFAGGLTHELHNPAAAALGAAHALRDRLVEVRQALDEAGLEVTDAAGALVHVEEVAAAVDRLSQLVIALRRDART